MSASDDVAALLSEYLDAREKIDAAAATVFERRAEDIACKRGCSSCCVEGLSVLSVEAAAIEQLLQQEGLTREPSPPPGGCAFLDDEGACTIYRVRPVVCRTHGLPLRMRTGSSSSSGGRRPLKVLDDVEVCALNFTGAASETGSVDRSFTAADVLDAERIAALLLVVEQRYRARAGLPGAIERVELSSLLPSSRT